MMLRPIPIDLIRYTSAQTATTRPQRLRWLLVTVAALLALAVATAGGCA